MEASQAADQQPDNYLYQYAANLLASGKSSTEVERLLMLKGLAADDASAMVGELENPVQDVRKAQAKKDMLYGGLWCVGGLALTLADVGFVFWGAILFGGIQFIKGVTNLK
ncbi:hypothetical protein FNT36_16275 [Hymenobacter setariae]|uniref:Uncharacterized protein n=1 Tax=Hymenobacter setariae TaxID=2594794 RepID=A0A558BRS6_9BACT|nr:hypothetical protein [Hymenobacter setariae]TVT39214.1 hypothetical protein FNT36_16275 [Hymenobacter setariae]